MDAARLCEKIGEATRDAGGFGVSRVDDQCGAVAQAKDAGLGLDEFGLRDQ